MDTKVIKKRGIVKKTENAGNEEINHFILTELSVGQWPDTGNDGEN